MKVLIIGGYGEFGGRVAQLLLQEGHTVLIAGRNLAEATRFCKQFGGLPLQFNRQCDLDKIPEFCVDVVVDAAGPFQAYHDKGQAYRVAEAALQANAHYLDLSDDGEFARGIEVLNQRAIIASRVVLSGVSSTPALSSAVASVLSRGMSRVILISSAILPGTRAPRGHSVMMAILGQVGNAMPLWRDNDWRTVIGWSNSKKYVLDDNTVRQASFIGTADTLLFPDVFKAESVLFRAGLEPRIEQFSLSALAWLRQHSLLPDLRLLAKPLSFAARLLERFGSDRGAMVVEVTGEVDNHVVERRWLLSAPDGVGPFVAATPIAVIVNHIDTIDCGARACISELPLDHYEQALLNNDIKTSITETTALTLFQMVLGDEFKLLPDAVQKSHQVYDMKVLKGYSTVTRGKSLIARLTAAVFRFPASADNVPLTVTKYRLEEGELWLRDFSGQQFRSYLSLAGSTNGLQRVCEKFGLLKFELSLPIEKNTLYWTVERGWFLGVPLPKFLLPVSNTSEFEKAGRMHFDVELRAPMGLGLLVRYRGQLTEDRK